MQRRFRIKIPKKVIVIAILLIILIAYLLIDSAMKPTIFELSQAQLQYLAIQAMNNSITENIGGVAYSDLVNLVKDGSGKIMLIQYNTLKMNELASKAALAAQDKIMSLGMQGIYIPLGTIMGSQLLTGKGPMIRIDFMPMGSVVAKFYSDIQSAGINQTRHRIYMTLNAAVKMVVGNTGQTVNVTCQALISETVIVGSVPNTFLESARDEILNLVPTD
jgi:sporulation protein YunB